MNNDDFRALLSHSPQATYVPAKRKYDLLPPRSIRPKTSTPIKSSLKPNPVVSTSGARIARQGDEKGQRTESTPGLTIKPEIRSGLDYSLLHRVRQGDDIFRDEGQDEVDESALDLLGEKITQTLDEISHAHVPAKNEHRDEKLQKGGKSLAIRARKLNALIEKGRLEKRELEEKKRIEEMMGEDIFDVGDYSFADATTPTASLPDSTRSQHQETVE